jgi:hypothetical protein
VPRSISAQRRRISSRHLADKGGLSGASKGHGDSHRLCPEQVRVVIEAGGRLPMHEVLRCRVRYFPATPELLAAEAGVMVLPWVGRSSCRGCSIATAGISGPGAGLGLARRGAASGESCSPYGICGCCRSVGPDVAPPGPLPRDEPMDESDPAPASEPAPCQRTGMNRKPPAVSPAGHRASHVSGPVPAPLSASRCHQKPRPLWTANSLSP